jgi:hypothetical protein
MAKLRTFQAALPMAPCAKNSTFKGMGAIALQFDLEQYV